MQSRTTNFVGSQYGSRSSSLHRMPFLRYNLDLSAVDSAAFHADAQFLCSSHVRMDQESTSRLSISRRDSLQNEQKWLALWDADPEIWRAAGKSQTTGISTEKQRRPLV